MKVIGKISSDKYICEVTHTELEKLADKYYGNLPRLEVGSVMNLGAGYDFRAAIKEACMAVVEAEGKFERARKTIHLFASMVSCLPEPQEGRGDE